MTGKIIIGPWSYRNRIDNMILAKWLRELRIAREHDPSKKEPDVKPLPPPVRR